MAMMAALAAGAQVAGTIIQAKSAHDMGIAQQNEANFQAAQMRENAKNVFAQGTIQAANQAKQTAFALSNAQAAAVGQGGTSTDPTVSTDMATIAGQGKLRALTDMYNAENKSTQMNTQAIATEYGGNLARQAGNTKMYSSILSGASSLYDKYGNPNGDEGGND